MASEKPLLYHTRFKQLTEILFLNRLSFHFAKPLQFRSEAPSVISHVSSHKEASVNAMKKHCALHHQKMTQH